MTTPHRTLQMALNALYSGDSPPNARQQATADAIREALAAPPAAPADCQPCTTKPVASQKAADLTDNGDMVMVPREPTPDMARAGRKAVAAVADKMEAAKQLAVHVIDFWQQVGHTPANEIYRAMIAAAPPAAPAVPDGMALVPDYRGYAALGTGQYLLDISGDANPAELIIHVATDAEKEGRTVGDLRDKPNPGEVIQPEKMAVRLAFFTVAGLDALERQLRILRETHFPESAAPAVPLTDDLIDELWRAPMSADWEHREFARAIEKAHGIGGGNGN